VGEWSESGEDGGSPMEENNNNENNNKNKKESSQMRLTTGSRWAHMATGSVSPEETEAQHEKEETTRSAGILCHDWWWMCENENVRR
jgi:hypothetical protein